MSKEEEGLKETDSPFSQEHAYCVWIRQKEESERLVQEIRQGFERKEGIHDQLIRAVQAIGFMTDNSILARLVETSLKQREQKKTETEPGR